MKLRRAVLVLALALAASGAAGQDATGRDTATPARAALDGRIPIEEGFPQLAAAPLDSPAWISGRLADLDPENEADAPERELLLRLRDFLEAHPQLTRPALADLRRDLRSRIAAAEAAFDSAGEEGRDAAAREVVQAQADVERLEDLLAALRRHAVAAAPVPAPDEDVARLGGSGAEAASARLTLLLPFLDAEHAATVQAALAAWREAPDAAAAVSPLSRDTDRLDELRQEASAAEEELRASRRQSEDRRAAIAGVETAAQKSFNDRAEKAAEIAARPVQLADANRRQADAEALYADLRGQVEELRTRVAEAGTEKIAAEKAWAAARSDMAAERRRLEPWKELAAAPVPDEAPTAARAALERWEGALDERLRVAGDLVGLEERHRDRMFVLLKDTKTLRRDLEEVVPASTRRQDRQYLIADVVSEARLILPLLEVLARHRLRMLTGLPSRWRDWTLFTGMLSGFFWLALVLVLWWASRRIARRGAPHLVRLLASRSQRYVPEDLWGMREPAVRALVSLVDLGAIGLLLAPVREAAPELGLVLLVALQVALYRLILGSASLAIATHPAVRPAVVTLEPEARELALATVRYAVSWLVVRQFLLYVALEILGAVTLHEILKLAFDVLLIALAVWAFHVWEPFLRAALERRDPLHPLVVFQTRRRLRLLRAFQGVAHAALYGYLWTRDLAARLGGWSSILDPFRRPASDAEDARPPELPGEVVKTLLNRRCPAGGRLERTEARAELDECYRRWLASRRRGVALVAGDEGMGKHVFIDSWCGSIAAGSNGDRTELPAAEPAPEILRLALCERLTTAADARSFLAESFGLDDPPAEPEALAGRINAAAAPRVVVLEDLQFAFLRRVDGFAALNYLLSVVSSACDQLLWVFTIHSPSWRYLASLGGLVHTEVFRSVIELQAFDEDELRWIVERRTAAAGHQVDFTPLLPAGARLRPNPLAVERVTSECYRRLAWVSQGNPTVALRLWRETLAAAGRGHLAVGRYCQPAGLPELRDADLFLLAAVRTHRSLTERELVEVTNMSPAMVGAALKHLEGRRLLTTRSKRYSIEPRYLPAINSDLRRRHFLHGSD